MNGYAGEVQALVLGVGWPEYEGMLRHLSGSHHGKLTAVLGYDAQLAPLIYGGSDILLMPSLFEPCGLGQLIAMRYGSPASAGAFRMASASSSVNPTADWSANPGVPSFLIQGRSE
jgi:hypothetical protein